MAHYYEKTAEGVTPRHFVPIASRPGESRPTRITDARKAGWYPSVTTVMGMLDKPALNDWRITEHLKQAYLFDSSILQWEDGQKMEQEEYIEHIKKQTQEALDKAPKDGTDFHDVLERYFSGNETDMSDREISISRNVEALLCDDQVAYEWITEKSFVHSMGFAGKVDLHWQDGFNGIVVDFKTKNTADKWKPGKMAYPEMAMQLAAYRVGLGLHEARCANVFICLETGEVEFYEWGPETLDKQWANFSDLLRIWLRNAEYVPGTV